jgi:hypothetical protein
MPYAGAMLCAPLAVKQSSNQSLDPLRYACLNERIAYDLASALAKLV